MATTENEYYLRAILLLAEGGGYILKAVLNREIGKRANSNLDQELKKFEKKIKHEFHWRQVEKLLPTPPGKTSVNTWDLQMLFGVIFILFRFDLTADEKKDIQIIKVIRHVVQAHASSASLDKDDFDDYYDQLTNAITSLASNFDHNTRDQCDSFVKTFATGPLDIKSSIDHLNELKKTDELFRKVLEAVQGAKSKTTQAVLDAENNLTKKLDDAKDNICTTIKEENGSLQKELIETIRKELSRGRCEKIQQVLKSKLTFRGDEQQLVDCADKIVCKIINKAIKRTGSDDLDEIIKAVDDILDEIENIEGCKVIGAQNSCILVYIECDDYKSLLGLLTYLESKVYQERLEALSAAILKKYGNKTSLVLKSIIPVECLQGLMEEINPTPVWYERSLSVPIKCTHKKGVSQLLHLFAKDEMTNRLDHLSDVLSKHLGGRISVQASLNLTEIRSLLEGEAATSDESESQAVQTHNNLHQTAEAKTGLWFRCDTSFARERTSISLRDWNVLKKVILKHRVSVSDVITVAGSLFMRGCIDSDLFYSLQQVSCIGYSVYKSELLLFGLLHANTFDGIVQCLMDVNKRHTASRLLHERYFSDIPVPPAAICVKPEVVRMYHRMNANSDNMQPFKSQLYTLGTVLRERLCKPSHLLTLSERQRLADMYALVVYLSGQTCVRTSARKRLVREMKHLYCYDTDSTFGEILFHSTLAIFMCSMGYKDIAMRLIDKARMLLTLETQSVFPRALVFQDFLEISQHVSFPTYIRNEITNEGLRLCSWLGQSREEEYIKESILYTMAMYLLNITTGFEVDLSRCVDEDDREKALIILKALKSRDRRMPERSQTIHYLCEARLMESLNRAIASSYASKALQLSLAYRHKYREIESIRKYRDYLDQQQ